MKLNVQPLPAARITLPFRLTIAPASRKKFQAETMSGRTFVDAVLDFEPGDFQTDDERIAATRLADQLDFERRTMSRIDDVSGIPITVTYPYDEADIQTAALDIVREAMQQQTTRDHAIDAFYAWWPTLQGKALAAADEIAASHRHQGFVDRLVDLEEQVEAVTECLDEAALERLLSEYEELKANAPTQNALTSALRGALASLPPPAKNIAVTLAPDGFCGSFDMHERIPRKGGGAPEDATATVTIIVGPDVVTAELNVTGCLIATVSHQERVALEGIEPLAAAIARLEPDGFAGNDRDVPSKIHKAQQVIERHKAAEEMARWIAECGSEHLRKGVALDQSMVRLYRQERATKVLTEQSLDWADWRINIDGTYLPPKASPSAKALKVLESILALSSAAYIGYKEGGDIIDGEVIVVPAGLFQNAPRICIERVNKTKKPRRPPH